MTSSRLGTHKCLNKCFLVGCPSTTFSALPGVESTCPTYNSNVWREALHSHFLWHIFREWSEPQGGQCKFYSVVCQASFHLAIWWKRKHNCLGVRRLGVSCNCIPKWLHNSGQVICPLQASLFEEASSIRAVLGQGLPALALQMSCAVGIRACLHPGVHGRHLGHFPWTCVCWFWPWWHSPCCSHKTVSEHLRETVSSPGPQAAVYPKTELSLISQEWPKQGFHSCPHMDPKKPTGTSEEAKLPIHGAFKASTLLTRNLRAGGTRMGNCVVPESLAGEFLSISLCSTALPTCLHLPLGTGESWLGRDLQSHLVHPLSLQIQKLSLERGTHSPRANSCLRGNSHQW